MEINRIEKVSLNPIGLNQRKEENSSSEFVNFLKEALNRVNDLQKDYENKANDFLLGNDVNVHNLMISAEKAKLSLELTVQIRNKAIEAYQEIMRMQI
ncbi:flagellar hook-basal body complex protein FliE [Thermovenabulum gondwanense]|uniref:Flagellar hook-basal body complex protein FliE n=1 Tax=Thermovenabulum gondwanense TaxID=520767 RepID=A0A162M9J0_9FIRM|nr:flagellar hook-basal body complex protein FliE [Thermovenabulum gondwanense]KYO64592.1 Flagellar hook-basal body complex protein FliE [Thermovenabulum gondwanense]